MSSYRMKYKIGATQYHIPVVDDIQNGGGIPNRKETFTVSGTWTVPVSTWYSITVKSGGGGGGGSSKGSTNYYGGSGGGEGGTSIGVAYLTQGTVASIVVGAGGTKATAVDGVGGKGGDSSVTVSNLVISSTGGFGGGFNYFAGLGGTGTIHGSSGMMGCIDTYSGAALGGLGGGNGRGGPLMWTNISTYQLSEHTLPLANSGAGGLGASYGYPSYAQDGAAGFVSFEWFDPNS